MEKKRGYNKKYFLLFSLAAALLCALAAGSSLYDTYRYTRERAVFLAESYGSQTRYELMNLYDDAFVLRELIEQGMLDAKGTKMAVTEKGFRNMSEIGIRRMNDVCMAFDDMDLITNVSLAMAEGPLQDGIPEKTVISYCFPYEINKSALGKNLMVQPKRDDAIRKVYQRQGELVIEGPFRRIQDNELVLTGRVAVKNPDGSPWGLVAVTLDMNPASPKYALQNINFAALQGQKYRYHLYKIENGAKLTIAASDQAAMAMTGGMKYDIELPNASCIIEVDKAGGWIGSRIIFLNIGIAFFVWLLSIFAVKKWLENKEAHREIADREEILRQIADNINGGVLTLANDVGFCIRYANDGFLKLIGYTREELENVPSFLRAHLIYEEDTPKFQALMDGVWHLHDKIDLEMRLLHKNGHYIPVLIRGSVGTDKDGVLVMYCVIVDISEQKRIIQELELEKERYDLLVQASNEIIFDVEVLPEHITWSPLYRKIFGFEPFVKLGSDNKEPLTAGEAAENAAAIRRFMQKAIENKQSDSTELLLAYANGEQHWFRIRAKCIIKDETVVRLVGKLENIDEEMQEKEKLQDISRTDQLTGVYNKAGFRTVVEPLLRDGGFGSFIFTDLDNFKTVNDTLGHQAGDKVLQEMAAKLRQFFRSEDIIGRFGGDEFYIYVPGLSPEATVQRAEALCRILHTTYDDVTVSASVGICYFPEHGQDFEKLVHLADMAAYVVKNNGKGGYHVYEPGDKI